MAVSSQRGRADGALPTVRDVAERAGVSVATVSYALNNPARVGAETLERVREAIDSLGFTRNRNASSLASRSTRTIGIVVVELTNSLFVDIVRGAQRASTSSGFRLQIASSDNDRLLETAHIDFFEESRLSGVLVAPMSDPAADVERLQRHGRPVVLLNYDTRRGDVCTVLVDNERAGYLAARHLIDLGHRRIALVAGREHLQPVALRCAGVRRAVAESEDAVVLEEIHTDTVYEDEGARVGQELAQRAAGDRPDAVIAVTDLLGCAIITQLDDAGLRVPDDIAVMGCDSNATAAGSPVPLTTVSLGGLEMGRAAVRLLVDEIAEPAGEHAHTTVTIQPTLVVRQSTVGRDAVLARGRAGDREASGSASTAGG